MLVARGRSVAPKITSHELIAVCVDGESMLPTIEAGDMVLCTPVADWDLTDGDIYVVQSLHGEWVKRVVRCFDAAGNCQQLKLISDYHLKYDPFYLPIKDVKMIFKVVKKMSGF